MPHIYASTSGFMSYFSRKFPTFDSWAKAQAKRTSYTERVARLHALHPRACLGQLDGHHGSKARLSSTKPVPMYRRSRYSLSIREKAMQDRALTVLSRARRFKEPLSKLARENSISVKAVLKATNGFRRVKNRWIPTKKDRISRVMRIYGNGKERFIELRDSVQASIIGIYHSDIGLFLETGDASILAKYKHVQVRDSSGVLHSLESDPTAIRHIEEAREDSEYFDIYDSDSNGT
jgi:hypothetical protein